MNQVEATDFTTGESDTSIEIILVEIGVLDPLTDATIVALYLLKEYRYGVTIDIEGLIEYFEYAPDEPDWWKRIGPSDRNIEDDMFYTRTLQYFRKDDKI